MLWLCSPAPSFIPLSLTADLPTLSTDASFLFGFFQVLRPVQGEERAAEVLRAVHPCAHGAQLLGKGGVLDPDEALVLVGDGLEELFPAPEKAEVLQMTGKVRRVEDLLPEPPGFPELCKHNRVEK